jgi:hypothetical protein
LTASLQEVLGPQDIDKVRRLSAARLPCPSGAVEHDVAPVDRRSQRPEIRQVAVEEFNGSGIISTHNVQPTHAATTVREQCGQRTADEPTGTDN